MFDAGSTGSRVHVFHFQYTEDGSVTLEKELFEQLKPGLSSFGSDAAGAAKSLQPLIDMAIADVPEKARVCTPIALKATAGLRMLGEKESNDILDAVRSLFEKSPFRMGADAVTLMSGDDEGPFAWLTVNFLLGTLNPTSKKKTSGIIDLGGGSTQLVFEPDDTKSLDMGPKAAVYDVSFQGRKIRTYQHSYLGHGLKEAQKSIFREVSTSAATKFACFPTDYSEMFNNIKLSNEGSSSFDTCHSYASKLFKKDATCVHSPCSFNGVFQPLISKSFSGDLLAFSFYYDRLEGFLPVNEIVTVGEIKVIGQKICDGQMPDKHKGTTCLDFAYLYALVATGYELPDTQKLHIKKKINGIETAWCLGAMILNM
jgi:guanosine-diphosphatase